VGDGIGPEVIMKPLKFLAIAIHEIIWTPALTGACAIDAVGVPYPDETRNMHESRRCFIWSNRTQNTITTQQQGKTRTRLLLMRKIRLIC
jgi:isocitrate/isopropylmalate dehydrogenase